MNQASNSQPTAYPEIAVTPWQSAFNGGSRIPVTCVLSFMADVGYWFLLLRGWDNDKDWNMDETARN